jgi:NitT/TauT family transport system ATP-binding protein
MRVIVRGVSKTFVSPRGEFTALKGVALDIWDRECLGIVGPNGCGKTTLLHIIAGLQKPTEGSVEFVGAKRADSMVSMVFQDPALMPWRSAEENVPLGVEFRGASRGVAKKVAGFFLRLLRLEGFKDASPHQLSGGMKQKVSLARALANSPEVLLMDEPFANLDAQTRVLLREELAEILAKREKTIVFVTHQVEEAILLCDRIAVMSSSPGRIKEVIRVDLPKPRSHKSMQDPRFAKAMDRIWELLRFEVERTMGMDPTRRAWRLSEAGFVGSSSSGRK